MYHLITDHTPMEDYQRIRSQAVCCVENANSSTDKKQNAAEMFPKAVGCRRISLAMKWMLLISVLLIPVCLVLIHVRHFKMLSLLTILVMIGLFAFSVVLGIIGAAMESYDRRKQQKIRAVCRRKTWVLSNGSVAVVYHTLSNSKKRMCKKRNNFLFQNEAAFQTTEVSFLQLYVIDVVYSISQNDHTILADTGGMEYDVKYPYRNDEREYSEFLKYFSRRTHKKIVWQEEQANAHELLDALNRLKKQESWR